MHCTHNVGTTCMGKLTAYRRSTEARWPITVQECPLVLLLLKRGDLRALFGSMFLDIFAVSGPIFLKPNLLPLVKSYTLSSLIISLLLSRKIIELLKRHLTHYWTSPLKTLFNIVEARFENCWTLMFVLYHGVPMDQKTARKIKISIWLNITN